MRKNYAKSKQLGFDFDNRTIILIAPTIEHFYILINNDLSKLQKLWRVRCDRKFLLLRLTIFSFAVKKCVNLHTNLGIFPVNR